ncbi:MAG: FAD-binding protein [Oscillospiraceae bacterium]
MNLKACQKIIKGDVLIIGGGVGGMQAAISAAEAGARVLVAEKADTRRSGNGSTGNDHFACYMPKYHGDDFERVIRETQDTMIGANCDQGMLREMLLKSEKVIHLWESYGIPMHPFGEYLFEGHTLPGRQRYHLKYDGTNQKPLLTEAAKKRGVVIYNHTTITELLTDESGRVTGAIGFDTSDEEPQLVVFEVRAAIITAGGADVRIFPNTTPAFMFNVTHCPANACAAAIAYRAGARLVNCDLLGRHASPRYFERAGKATWLGIVTGSDGKPVGSFASKPSREYGDPLTDIWPGVFQARMKDSSGPTYMDCTEMSPEDLQYMLHCFDTEGISALSDYFEQHDIDLGKSMIEFGSTGLRLARGGIDINKKAEASLPGLYASGNICGNVSGGITCAAVFGMLAGENAAEYIKTVPETPVEGNSLIEEKAELYQSFLTRENGADWQEVNSTAMQIMQDYLGSDLKSESMMKSGLKYLRDLKAMALEQLKADNAHELMRTVEVLDIMDMGEIAFLSVMNRRETRGQHKRSDYKYTNPLLTGLLGTAEKKDGGICTDFRPSFRK